MFNPKLRRPGVAAFLIVLAYGLIAEMGVVEGSLVFLDVLIGGLLYKLIVGNWQGPQKP